jgi:hypothetical protein
MPDETTTTEAPPLTVTNPVNPTSTPQSDPAFVPSPLQPPVPPKDPWEEDAFKAEVAAAGFPGSPQTDGAFMAALFKFKGGGTTPPAEPPPAA